MILLPALDVDGLSPDIFWVPPGLCFPTAPFPLAEEDLDVTATIFVEPKSFRKIRLL